MIIQFGGVAFSTAPLNMSDWIWCLLFGVGTLLWGQIVTTIPNKCLCFGKFKKEKGFIATDIEDEDVDIEAEGKFLWIRGFSRIRTQVSL